MKYEMTVTGGGGTEQYGGEFLVKQSPKTIIFVCTREPFFSNRMSNRKKPLRINKYYTKKVARDHYEAWRDMKTPTVEIPYRSYMNNGHVARFWEDGTITVYPDQCGIPHYLQPITE